MQSDAITEARRQAEICNACRYCEGYCAVFPELHTKRVFGGGDIAHLANLCHDCRGCFYACQYTAPHEFNLNLAAALAEVRRESWEEFAWPRPIARAFHQSGVLLVLAVLAAIIAIFAVIQMVPNGDGAGFYAILSHSAMVAIFAPAFVFPLVSLGIGLRRFWRSIGGGQMRWRDLLAAIRAAAELKNLKGGHGDGCNFEDEDRFTHARRWAHQAVMYGFLLCFLSTVSGTVLHYGFNWPAPYGFWTPPKLLGVPGGIMMVFGTLWMAWLKLRANDAGSRQAAWGGEMAFVLLLFLVAATGLALYWLGATVLLPWLLVVHLGSVLCLFLLTPYTKMAHGFYRLAALAKSRG